MIANPVPGRKSVLEKYILYPQVVVAGHSRMARMATIQEHIYPALMEVH